MGSVFLMFAFAPLLSPYLGDFWSSALFLPVWGLVYLVVWLLRRFVVIPRVGVARFGQARTKRLKKLSYVMLAVNVLALILGIVVAANLGGVPGQMIAVVLGLFFLVGFSLSAYFLDLYRLYFYGLLVAFSPLVGEWLYANGKASHHGFPLVFGITAGIMILVGLVLFIRLLHDNPVPSGSEEEDLVQEA
ncbi:MAG: hypothetical protein H6666_00110 [Ardenticatenaceae bacterium]|nr:hypothetical protein [Ardenticatenaceae bacterium]